MAFELGVKNGLIVKGSWPLDEQIKAISEETRTIDFVFSDETLDRDTEIIRAVGWKLEAYRKNPVFLFAHDHLSIPIGQCFQVWITETAKLMGRVKFAGAENGNEMGEAFFRLYRDKFMNCVSVGFMGLRCEYPAEYGQVLPSGASREFIEQELLECSAVPVPANPNAGMMRSMSLEPGETDAIRHELDCMQAKGVFHEATLKAITGAYDRLEARKALWFPLKQCKHEEPCEDVKARGECEYRGISEKNAPHLGIDGQSILDLSWMGKKKISGKKGLPLAATDIAWSASAARKRMALWASSDGSGDKDKIDWKKFGQGHVVLRDEDTPENMGSYILPFADVINDTLTAIPRGLFTAAAVMMGARGGVELSDTDREGAKKLIRSYYSTMEMTPPWEEERSTEGVIKAGQVLNASNKRLIKMMHECCHEMMANAGMEPMDMPPDEEPPMEEPEEMAAGYIERKSTDGLEPEETPEEEYDPIEELMAQIELMIED